MKADGKLVYLNGSGGGVRGSETEVKGKSEDLLQTGLTREETVKVN